MSDYVKSTDFASKDTLPSGDSAKIVRGTEIDAEFEALEVAIATKANTSDVASTYAPLNSPALTGSPTAPTPTSGDNDTSIATTAFVTTAIAATKGPAFSAYQSTLQSVSNASFTKVQLQTEEFDTASAFNNTGSTAGGVPAYAFLPTVAGYYQVNGAINFGTASGVTLSIIYKNGVRFKDGQSFQNSSVGNSSTVNALIYMNGSTDYVELYAYQTSGSSQNSTATQNATYFQASMVRGA